jgi:hypothetical protein
LPELQVAFLVEFRKTVALPTVPGRLQLNVNNEGIWANTRDPGNLCPSRAHHIGEGSAACEHVQRRHFDVPLIIKPGRPHLVLNDSPKQSSPSSLIEHIVGTSPPLAPKGMNMARGPRHAVC